GARGAGRGRAAGRRGRQVRKRPTSDRAIVQGSFVCGLYASPAAARRRVERYVFLLCVFVSPWLKYVVVFPKSGTNRRHEIRRRNRENRVLRVVLFFKRDVQILVFIRSFSGSRRRRS